MSCMRCTSIPSWFSRTGFGLFWAGVLLLWGGPAAEAGPLTIYASNETAWTATFGDPVTLNDVTDRPNAEDATKQSTALTGTMNFGKDVLMLVITFEEKAPSKADVGGTTGDPPDGLNFTLTHTIENRSGRSWVGFEARLVDRDRLLEAGDLFDAPVPNNKGTDRHPAISHFHTRGDSFELIGMPKPFEPLNLSAAESGNFLKFGNGKLTSGNDFGFKVRIHDILVEDFQRRFDLVLKPIVVPEPSTWVSLALGGVILAFYGGSQRLRREQPSR